MRVLYGVALAFAVISAVLSLQDGNSLAAMWATVAAVWILNSILRGKDNG